jgi:hypothetical protein
LTWIKAITSANGDLLMAMMAVWAIAVAMHE